MISRLRGLLVEKDPPRAVIEVGGVGYELEMPMNDICALPEIGAAVMVYTEQVFKEDSQDMYGFLSKNGRMLFNTLIKISGIGAKTALLMLSNLTVDELCDAVRNEDSKSLSKIPSIGKKTAEKIIFELRDKVAALELLSDAEQAPSGGGAAADSGKADKANRELAIRALTELGYAPKLSEEYVNKVWAPGKSVQDIIKEALRFTFGKK